MVIAVFVNQQREFEAINHNILAKTLSSYGIEEFGLQWSEEYLYEKHHRATVNNILSTKNKNDEVIPQGSVSGPLKFHTNMTGYPQNKNYNRMYGH